MKKILTFALTLTIFLTSTVTAFAYLDISSQYKYSEAVEFITEKGIVSGYPDGTYQPLTNLNRAELLKILVEAKYSDMNIDSYSYQSCFSDVPEGEWFTKYVCFAKEQGFVEGYNDGTFKPANQINLVETLKITLEIFNYEYDQSSNPWYQGLVITASVDNFIPSDFTQFNETVNRGQMADLITRILKYEEGTLEEYLDPKGQIITYEYLENPSYEFDPLNDSQGISLPTELQLEVPFQAQAPYGNWVVPYDEACEETSLIMIDYYLNGLTLSKNEASDEILSMIEWEEEKGYGVDIGTTEIKDIIENYYYKKAKIYSDSQVTAENIKLILASGHPVIIPVAGQYLGNPNFKSGGPPYHVLILTGYNETGFYAHDPGTSHGENYIYSYDIIPNVIHDWNGSKTTVLEGEKAIIVMGN